METPQGKSKGANGGVVSIYLWRCPGQTVSFGAAQLYTNRPPFEVCLGFLAAGQDGRHPKNWLSGIPVSTKPRRMLCLLGLLLFSMMLILPVAGMEDLDGMKVDYGRMHG